MNPPSLTPAPSNSLFRRLAVLRLPRARPTARRRRRHPTFQTAACVEQLEARVVLSAVTGAVFTTDAGGIATNDNIYSSKDAVYLNGGPRKDGAAGLPDGPYYVKVTAPDGTLLGVPPQQADGTPIPTVQVIDGEFAQVYQLSAIVVMASTAPTNPAPGYDDTTNAGGEYKVWVSLVADFELDDTKTDNFKIRINSEGTTGSISGLKFYDTDTDGERGADEPGVSGVRIFLEDPLDANGVLDWADLDGDDDWDPGEGERWTRTGEATPTREAGFYEFLDLEFANYLVREDLDSLPGTWIQTTEEVIPVTIDGQHREHADVNFGNVQLGEGGGHTLGFWSNKNGQKLIGDDDIAELVGMNLVNEDGASFIPTCARDVKQWLLNGKATNMAYMLSVQSAAMQLNVLNDFVEGDALVHAAELLAFTDEIEALGFTGALNGNGFISINGLLAIANAELGQAGHNVALADSEWRAFQEALKNVLDAANNNQNFVQPPVTSV